MKSLNNVVPEIPIYWQTLRYFDPLFRDAKKYKLECVKGRKEWLYKVAYNGRSVIVQFDVSKDLLEAKEFESESPITSFYRYGLVVSAILVVAAGYLTIAYSSLLGLIGLVPLSILVPLVIKSAKIRT